MNDLEFLCENILGLSLLTVITGVQSSSMTDLGSSEEYASTSVCVTNDSYSVDWGSVDLLDNNVELKGAL